MARTKSKFKTRLEFTQTGLVCSGGATKAAAFHIGVALALRDKGFTFVGGRSKVPTSPDSLPFPRPRYNPFQISTYVGSSAGAFIVTMLAAGVSIDSILRSFSEASEMASDPNAQALPRITYRDMLAVNWPRPSQLIKSFQKRSVVGKSLESMVLGNLRLPGLFSTRGFAEYMRRYVLPTDLFHELEPNLFVVGTQLDHSRKIIFGRYGTESAYDTYSQYASNVNISDAVAASMSLPPIFVPHLIRHHGGKQRYYIDGEIRETLSTHVGKENGCDLLICSYTHQPYHYKEEIGSLYHYGVAAVVIQALYQAIEQKVYGAKKAHENKISALRVVEEFFRRKKYPEEDLLELNQILERELDFRANLNYIFINPEPRDREMFFGDHFTLNPKILQGVASIGYRRAMNILRRYDFAAKETP